MTFQPFVAGNTDDPVYDDGKVKTRIVSLDASNDVTHMSAVEKRI
jgi:hypothetical protein